MDQETLALGPQCEERREHGEQFGLGPQKDGEVRAGAVFDGGG
jgi:hypothetical protein